MEALQRAGARGDATRELLQRYRARASMADAYARAYRRYCWPVASVDDLRIAPFHLLATEGAVHAGRDHGWHMQTLADLCAGRDQLLEATPFRTVDLHDEAARDAATAWWEALTEREARGWS